MTLETLKTLMDEDKTVRAIIHAMALRERDMKHTNAKELVKEMRSLGYTPQASDLALAFSRLTALGLCETRRVSSADGRRHHVRITWAKQWPPSSWKHLGATPNMSRLIIAKSLPKARDMSLKEAMKEYLSIREQLDRVESIIKDGMRK